MKLYLLNKLHSLTINNLNTLQKFFTFTIVIEYTHKSNTIKAKYTGHKNYRIITEIKRN